MKILYDYQFFPVLRFSGISRYFYELAKYLIKQPDCETSIFMGFHINEFAFDALSKEAGHFFGMRRPDLPGSKRICDYMNRKGLPLFASLHKSNIYHQTYYSYLLPKFKGKRVLTVYDMIYFLFPQYFRNDEIMRDTRMSVQSASGILAISETSKRDLIAMLDVPEEKISVTYLANSLKSVPQGKNPLGCPYILFVGQRFHWKNFISLLNVYSRNEQLHKNYKLVCFGGLEWTESEIEILSRAHLRGRIIKTSGPDELLATYYAHAGAFVYPSLYEGFGLPVLEAMHYGCPVIASNAGSIPEVGGDAALYFDPKNEEMLETTLIKCLEDRSLQMELSEKGKRQEAKFSWDKCGRETCEFYRNLP